MKDPLAKLFGSVGRVKVMRLFLLADTTHMFTAADVTRQTKMIKTTITKELRLLTDVGFLNKTKSGYSINTQFEYLQPLRHLLTFVAGEQEMDLAKRIRKTGRIKAVIVSGVFVQSPDARVDLVIVGDALKRRMLEAAITAIEAELGRELRYAIFTTDEFIYRRDMRDKLVSDILDNPHKALVDNIGLKS